VNSCAASLCKRLGFRAFEVVDMLRITLTGERSHFPFAFSPSRPRRRVLSNPKLRASEIFRLERLLIETSANQARKLFGLIGLWPS
jgi:hypothetical protein